MRRQLIIGGLALASIGGLACQPTPVIGQPGYCGQTQDGTAVVALHQDIGGCTAVGGKRISVAELCGPIMPGSNAADDCWRGNIPGRPSPDNFRYGSIVAAGGQAINIVASDATAP